MIRVGLCGFTMAMADYPLHFPVVEVQQTFYEPPADAVMKRWLSATPRGFELTMKAWQLVTHEGSSPTYRRMRRVLTAEERASCGAFRDRAIVRFGWERTLACATLIGATAILFQCPARFVPSKENVERMRRFFGEIAERPPRVRFLWEPRGPRWTENAALAESLANELGLGYVVDPFVDAPPRQPNPYFRLHGISGARHVYSDGELERLAAMTPDDAYVMFNNIPRVGDAKRFAARVVHARNGMSTERKREQNPIIVESKGEPKSPHIPNAPAGKDAPKAEKVRRPGGSDAKRGSR